MRVETITDVNEIGENVRRVRKDELPCSSEAQETPVSSGGSLIFFGGEQRKEKRQPGEKQIPDQKCVAEVAGPDDAR